MIIPPHIRRNPRQITYVCVDIHPEPEPNSNPHVMPATIYIPFFFISCTTEIILLNPSLKRIRYLSLRNLLRFILLGS